MNTLRLISLIALALAMAPLGAMAQNYPTKPIRLIVGFAPGGGVDINARLLGPKLTEYLGQAVIIDNKPGAGTNIANEFVAKSAPDGYTLLINTAAVAINMTLYKSVPYDALRDFAPVSIFSVSPNVLVVPASVPAKNVKELVALARSQPGKLNYSSAGAGTTQHLSAELFKTLTKTSIQHVPYKGSGPSLSALVAGEVQISFANIPAISGHVKAGKLRALALTGSKRSDQLADVPTLQESGINMDVDVWYGVFAPAATPRPVVIRLSETIARAANSPDIRKRLTDLGAEPRGTPADEFAKFFRAEVATWGEVVKASGATAEN
jgi:tripartite-type tricarboxylate transporter receptor subunit TctC